MRTSMRRRKWRPQGGFTLIEIMVVVVILGILAAAIIPNVVGSKDEARVSAAKTDIATLVSAIERFYLNMDRYPTTEEGLQVLVAAPQDNEGNRWRGPYVQRVPRDPWGRPYVYESPGRANPGSYDLQSFGRNGNAGGEDENIFNADIQHWTMGQDDAF